MLDRADQIGQSNKILSSISQALEYDYRQAHVNTVLSLKCAELGWVIILMRRSTAFCQSSNAYFCWGGESNYFAKQPCNLITLVCQMRAIKSYWGHHKRISTYAQKLAVSYSAKGHRRYALCVVILQARLIFIFWVKSLKLWQKYRCVVKILTHICHTWSRGNKVRSRELWYSRKCSKP